MTNAAGNFLARSEELSPRAVDAVVGVDAAEPGHVTFLANPRYTPRVQTTRASAVYLAEGAEVGRDLW